MKANFKNIHIGKLIKERVAELQIDEYRVCNFVQVEEQRLKELYSSESVESYLLLRFSKLLEYDFFRIYSHHLILYAPQRPSTATKDIKTNLPQFRKNIYTQEIIDFLLELLEKGEKDKHQIINDYRIPKTTLYKWIKKYKK